MGTSKTSTGPGKNVSLVPNWIDPGGPAKPPIAPSPGAPSSPGSGGGVSGSSGQGTDTAASTFKFAAPAASCSRAVGPCQTIHHGEASHRKFRQDG